MLVAHLSRFKIPGTEWMWPTSEKRGVGHLMDSS